MKAIVLAGGQGTRLFPATRSISKQLLPIYDKPALYYPLSILLLAGLRDILMISTPRDLPLIQDLLGTGEHLGIRLSYAAQPKPEGIAQAFLIGESFIDHSPCGLILGDNIFYGETLIQHIQSATQLQSGAQLFAYHVPNPERYGVIEFNQQQRVLSLEEKPQNPKSHWVVTGLYFYDAHVVSYASTLTPSKRGELEITDLNRIYLQKDQLTVNLLGRGVAWLDAGTHETYLQSSLFVQTIEQRQGYKIACLEEIAYQNGFISKHQLENLVASYPQGSYRLYLEQLLLQPGLKVL